MKSCIRFLCSTLLLTMSVAFAQTSLQLDQMSFTAELEQRLNSDIERIAGQNVHVLSVQAEFIREQVESPSAPKPMAAPSQPEVKNIVINNAPDLPGLSGVSAFDRNTAAKQAIPDPEIAEPQSEVSDQQASKTEMVIRSLSTRLLLDNSVDKDKELLIRNLLLEKLEYNPMRGDRLEIIRMDMVPVEEVGANTLASYWWVLALLLLLLLLVLGYVLMRNRKTENKEVTMTDVGLLPPTPDQLLDNKKGELKECRQQLVKYSLSEPQKVDAVLRRLSLNEQNVPMLASCYQELGRSLFTSMYPALIDHIPAYLKYLETNPADYDRLVRDLTDLQHLLVDAVSSEQFEHRNRPFSFLDKLSINQIRWILDDEPLRIKALVISQLSAESSAQFLSTFTPQEQALIAIEIVQFDSMPMATFGEIASSLAVKAQSVPDFETVRTDGNQMLMSLLDGMNLRQQTDLLYQLKLTSPEAYINLRKIYYMFDDVLRTPSVILSNTLRSMDPMKLSLALTGLEDAQVAMILSGFPERMAEMIKSEIGRSKDTSSDEQNSAKQDVVILMRQAIENKVFTMNELESIA
ncbi:FliG C-terminal domain-containing protein [Aliivibrio finisterrensis]|uniref:FliG C-terminal domain-containing protein n=1 Tax=Aliivibrio finisterrensis TaxID=511998 RepID=UPI001F5CCC87|nr:FliG C-terminal domain-containing protein [Aliivibrio finisterrensis]